jgi:DNA-binding transcriptional LysR family regulator
MGYNKNGDISMSDEKLKTFLTVVRCGSLTQAAKELFISQPAITMQIHKLEKDYKETLLYRRERGIELTPAGKVLLDYARRISRLYDEASEEIGALSGDIRGTIRIGATFTIGEYFLPPVLGHFKDEHPATDIILEIENTRRVVDEVAAGNLDCGLVEGPFENGLIYAEKLSDDELVFVCSSKHKLANTAQIDLETLLTENFILREPGSGTRKVFEDALKKAGLDSTKLKVLIQLNTTQAIKSLVAENIGVTVISERTVRNEIQQGILKSIPVPSLDLRRTFQFIFKKDMQLSLITRRFVSQCRQNSIFP